MRERLRIFNKIIPFYIFLSFIFLQPATLHSQQTANSIEILEECGNRIILKFSAGEYVIQPQVINGTFYNKIIIPRCSFTTIPGSPELPVKGTLIAIPRYADVEIEIINSEYTEEHGYRIPPVPTPVYETIEGYPVFSHYIIEEDLEAYASEMFPEKPVILGKTGILRGQQVAQIIFYPVQYFPLKETVRIYNNITVELRFSQTKRGTLKDFKGDSRKSAEITFYESLKRSTILNYRETFMPRRDVSQPLQMTQSLPSTSVLKIFIEEDGIYKLSYEDLQDAGFPVDEINPKQLMLENLGVEIPIVEGEEDGQLDLEDYVMFYGEKYEDVYADQNVYFLSTGDESRLRITTVDGSFSDNGSEALSFEDTLHLEENYHYFQNAPPEETDDHWFWEDFIAPGEASYYFPSFVPDLNSQTASLKVNLFGASYSHGTEPDHHVMIYLNDHLLEDAWWDGQTVYEKQYSFPTSCFSEDTNQVKLELPGDTGAEVEVLYPNWFELTFQRLYEAVDDQLFFSAPDNSTEDAIHYRISGFTSPEISLFDITDKDNPLRLTPEKIEESDNETYSVFFEAEGGNRDYYAVMMDAWKKPFKIITEEPSSLNSSSNQADYIIITHPDFTAALQELVELREDQGLSVRQISVEDIYDEFNHGIFSPIAIKDFLQQAYFNWQKPAPSFVLLVGDASYDYKDNFELGDNNFVPTMLVDTYGNGETASDHWFVCIDGDDLYPDMAIGRIPARTPEQVEAYVAKLIEYEEDRSRDPWKQEALIIAEAGLESLSDNLTEYLDGTFNINRVYMEDYEDPLINPDPVTEDIMYYWNEGTALISYIGHGGHANWAWGSPFHYDDISSLKNEGEYPFVLALTCLNGFFDDARAENVLAEGLTLSKDKGAIAFFSATRSGSAYENMLIGTSLFKSFFDSGHHNLGFATTEAKIQTLVDCEHCEDIVNMYALFGDPATYVTILIPEDVNVSGRIDGEDLILVSRAWGGREDCIGWQLKKDMDINKDGIIDQQDFELLEQKFGEKYR